MAPMHDLNDLDAFAHVVDHGGFSAAERALGIPKSRLSRRVAALEAELGARLLQRSTRRFAVTDLGREVHRHALDMRAAAQAASDAIARARSEPQGLLRVSVPVSVAEQEFPVLLPRFLAAHPHVRLQLMVSNRRFDLIEEAIDVALRVRTRLDSDASLVLRRFGNVRSLLIASPDYLARHGWPQHPDALAEHGLLSMGEDEPAQWSLTGSDGETRQLVLRPRLMARSFPLLVSLAEAGVGIALLPETACAGPVRAGRLTPVLHGWSLPQGIFHAVYPSRRGMLPAVRAFVDFLAAELPPLLAESRLACDAAAGPAAG
jgi:DNA-binding transcriptional LysR family regulator